MQYKKLLDLHVHTDNSFDGNHSTTYLCERAQMLGLRVVAFTDHSDIDTPDKQQLERSALQSFFEISKAKSAFRGRMIICKGIELGQPVYDIETSEKILNSQKYDFVIGSIHNLRGMQDFWYLDYSKENVPELLDKYFDEIINLVDWGNFDTLAHLTYPLRYIVGDSKIPVDLSKYDDKINLILKTLAEKELALEINTSGLRQNLKKTMPEADIVRRFKEFGGKYITIGSDAHYAEHLGAGINEGMNIAKDCGFDSVTLYQNREPIQIPIE